MADVNYTHGRCKATKANGDRCLNNSQPNSDYCGPHDKAGSKKSINKEENIAIYEEQFWSQWNYVLTGTGTRKLQNADKDTKVKVMNQLVAKINELKEEHDSLVVMSGGAEGFDSALIAAAKHCNVPYVMALPSPSYGEYYWGKKSQTGYNRLDKFKEYMEGAAQVIYVCQDHQWGKANFIRNDYMMKWAHEVLAYDPTGKSTGTQHAIKGATRHNLLISYID